MTNLREAAEMALEALEESWEEHEAIDALRQALAQPEQEAFTLDRGCWERGCTAYDTRDGDGVIVYVDPVLKEKNT
jgi:hypothetical protein